jgi:predicted nucleic acid-binding Zn ribbon protein
MTDDAPGVDAWKRNTSAFDRVQSVASTVSEPQPAAAIADEARVAENTARDHLERLAEMNVLLKTDDGGTTTYAPDPLHTRMQTLRDLLDAHDHNGLVDLKVDLQEQIETWQDSHGVRSPEELREQAADTDDAATTREIQATAREWELVDYRLDIVEDAIANYSTYTRPDQASA